MKNPQTTAQELYKTFKLSAFRTVAESACCAFTLMWCLHMEPISDYEAIQTVREMISAGALKKDCTVKWYDAVKYLTGRPLKGVDFVPVTDIKEIKDRAPVLYKAGNSYHWVGVENGEIKFNSLEYSKSVTTGKPVEARILKF